MKIITFLLLGTYIGLSPVYWWPGVSPSLIDTIKFILIGSAVILIWIRAFLNGKLYFPPDVLGPLGFLMLVFFSFIAIAQSSYEALLQQMKDYTLVFVMLWTFNFYVSMGHNPNRVFAFATLIIAAHCALVASSKFFGVPRWSGPSIFVAPELWISGFGSLRTGWSCSVAPFVPLALSMALPVQRAWYLKLIYILAAAVIVMSQLVVSGRSGMLASFLGTLWIITGKGQRRWLPVFILIGVTAIALASDFFYEAMRLQRLANGGMTSIHDLNKFSAHRIDSDIIAFNAFLERPILGHGFHNFTFSDTEIHNLWLRLAVEGGIFVPLALAVLVWRVWSATHLFSNAKSFGLETRYMQAVVLMGGFMSMFEPRILLGTFQLNAVWWAVAGISGAKLLSQKVTSSRL